VSLVQCLLHSLFFFQAEDGIRDRNVTGVQTCALPISLGSLCTDTWTDNETQKQRERTYMRGLQVGIDMNRYIVASQRMDALHTPEGMVLNSGSEALHINKDYTVDKDDVMDETGVEEVVPASFGDPREAEAEKEEAAVANF